MLLIDDLLLLPISGFKFIFRTLQKVAEEQYTDDAPVKERLLELQVELENGDISEEDYIQQEAAILKELRAIENRKREMAGLPPEEAQGGFVLGPGGKEGSAVSVTFHQDAERKKRKLGE
jgi:Gas vesicle protein G